jgi:SAM-dependent methyltransferase
MHELVVRALRALKRRFPRSYALAGRVRRALGPPARTARARLGRLLFERGGQDTSDPGSDRLPTGYNRYEPSQWTYLPRALRGERVGPRDVFVDVGCGRGRVVLQAARRPFARVVGVEISPEKLATARHNLERAASTLACKDVELVAMDALDYDIPPDATYVYLFNPCAGDAFRRLLDNVVASYDRRPRRLRVLYVNPVEAAMLERSDRFVRRRISRGLRHDHRIVVYEVTGTGARAGTDAAGVPRAAGDAGSSRRRS